MAFKYNLTLIRMPRTMIIYLFELFSTSEFVLSLSKLRKIAQIGLQFRTL